MAEDCLEVCLGRYSVVWRLESGLRRAQLAQKERR